MEKPERQPYIHWTTCYDYRGDVDYRRVFLHPLLLNVKAELHPGAAARNTIFQQRNDEASIAITMAEMFDKRVIRDSTYFFHDATNVPDLRLSQADQVRCKHKALETTSELNQMQATHHYATANDEERTHVENVRVWCV